MTKSKMTKQEYIFHYGTIGWKRRPKDWQTMPVPTPFTPSPLSYDRDRSIANGGKGTYCPDLNQVCYSKADAIEKGKAKGCTYIS